MSEGLSNVVYLCIFAIASTITAFKLLALRRDPTPTLALTAAMFLTASPVYILASPVGYRAVGEALDQPSFATLPVYLGILACFAYTHIITFLVDQELQEESGAMRRIITTWTVVYVTAAILMTALFSMADLSQPADPLEFNTHFASDPWALGFLAVFLLTFGCGTLNTFWRCRRLVPEDPQLRHSLKVFGVAMWFVFGYIVLNVPAIVFAAFGNHSLDTVALWGNVTGVTGFLSMCYGLSGSAVGHWLRERHDIKSLQPLWDLVVGGVDEELAFSARNARSTLHVSNVTFNLHRRVIEILDGIRRLRGWVAPGAAEAVHAVHSRRQPGNPHQPQKPTSADLEAAATAAALWDAVDRLQAARREWASQGHTGPPPPPGTAGPLPGENTPAGEERDRLLRVAKALGDPLVHAALQKLRSDRTASAAAR